jgi:3-oxoacyl-[acyl-carrier-protein] synthase III
VEVSKRFAVLPRSKPLPSTKEKIPCTNEDLIRNHAYCWSRMTPAEISEKTGIEQRCYTELSLEEMALIAAKRALAKSGPPARGNWRRAVLQLHQHPADSVGGHLAFGRVGIIADPQLVRHRCRLRGHGLWLAEAVRLLQEIERPLLLVCAEKFSDKIGTVRTSRMIFGDGAAAVVVGPAPEERALRHRDTSRLMPAVRGRR